jgi:S-adenosylmethionine uptake transporter
LPQAFAVASLGIATFAGMDVVMKGLALELGAYNAIFWRSTFVIVLAGILYWWQRTSWPSLTVLKTPRFARAHRFHYGLSLLLGA